MLLVDAEKFQGVMHDCMLDEGINSDVANTVTTSLTKTSLKGVDSHGIGLFPHYYVELSAGRINKNPQFEFDQKSASAASLDAKNTFGHFAGERAMLKATTMAKDTGVGIVSVKNSTHFGAAWYFTDIAASHGMIGLALTNTEALVNAYNSKEAYFGTNPFCFSAPIKNEEPFCLDMATSTVPWNKIKNYRRQNIPLDLGWAYDINGNTTVNPHDAISLSAVGGYKGFGLGMVVEILCSGLAAGPISKDIAPLYDLSIKEDRKISHFFMALDISKFVSLDWFKVYMLNMATQIRTLPKSGQDDVVIAGDKEKETSKIRQATGIPIDDSKFNEFLQISKKFEETVV